MKFHDGPCAPSFWFPSGERQMRLLLEMYDQGGVIEFTNRIYFDRCGAEFSITTLRGLDHKGLVHYSWPFRMGNKIFEIYWRTKNMTTDNNQYFIIRSDRAGVFFAQIAERRGSEVDLINCRRIHGWSNACSLSQVATDGCGAPGGNNRHSVMVDSMTVFGVVEIIPCTPAATENLLGQPVWRR